MERTGSGQYLKNERYQIGSYIFEIRHMGEIPFPEFFSRFRCEDALPAQCIYELSLEDHLPPMEGEPAAERGDIEVYMKSGREQRMFRFSGSPLAYGCYEEIDNRNHRCILRREFLQFSRVDTVFCSLFALERHLLNLGGCVLHCAALCVQGKMILFSGPSGIGKSTHAALWQEQVPGTFLLNGDQALLQKYKGQWNVFGWPVCGSSGICMNAFYPLYAVVFLRQSAENGGEALRGAAAVKRLVSQLTVNSWNVQAVTRIWELAEEIAGDVPVYDYGCNMEPEAVRQLCRLLAQGDGAKGKEDLNGRMESDG